jgi:hypothetical protein
MKSKRAVKGLHDEEAESNVFVVPTCNLKPDLQTVTSAQVCLDFDAVEMSEVSLIDRARLFVRLL